MSPQHLGTRDSRILSQIFDPESAPSPGITIDASLPSDPHIADAEVLSKLQSRELEAIRCVEQASETNDEKEREGAFSKAYELLSSLIQDYPNYASPFNNRAQLLRWRYGDKALVEKHLGQSSNPTAAIITDLNAAIALATPPSPSSPLSPSQAKLLGQAHTQRATLLYTAAKLLKTLAPADTNRLNQAFKSYGYEMLEVLEEESSRDFFMGGRYGNEVSKAMAVHTNPYAKMCGAIVEEAMKKEFSGALKPEKSDIPAGKAEA